MIFDLDIHSKCDSLLETIEENCRKAALTRSQIKRLKLESQKNIHEEDIVLPVGKNSEKRTIEEKVDSDFEDEISFYLESYRDLDDDFTKDGLIDLLPNRKHYEFEKILLRLQAESLRDIKEVHELIMEDTNITKSELVEYNSLIAKERKKMAFLKEILSAKEEEISQEKEPNKIILVPTSFGNIRILDEMDHIPNEYYPGFAELIQSIIDGTFKNVKCFTNNNQLSGMYEVKGYQVRVVFTRLKKDTYAVITGFVKKTTNDKFYQDQLKNKVNDFKNIMGSLKKCCDDPEWILENDKYVEQLFQVLGISTEDSKEYKKGDDHE